MNNPLVSVIIPVYNAERYVREAVESVLGQTYAPLEIICVDDCSTDGSVAVLSSLENRIRVVRREENGGIAKARNSGLREVRGEYIAFLDADDYWETEKLAVQMEYLKQHPGLSILFSFMRCFISPELPDEVKQKRFCPPVPVPGHIAGTVLIKKELFERVGYFDEKWKVGEFIDWIARAESLGEVYETLPDVFLHRRIHTTNTGITDRSARSDYLKIVKEALERKRRGV